MVHVEVTKQMTCMGISYCTNKKFFVKIYIHVFGLVSSNKLVAVLLDKERWGHQDLKGVREYPEHMGHLEFLVPRGQWGRWVCVEAPACLGLKGNREPRAHQQEGPPTFAGGGQSAPVTRELSWSTLEELEGLAGITKEELLTTSACQMIQITSSTKVEFKA